jgi:hypothetical protein
MMKVASTRLWESKMLTKDQMYAWENKTAAQQTWKNLQDYFTEKWLEPRQYSQATTKHLWFKDAAPAAQELAAAEKEGKTTTMMFALIQDQHKAQLEAMAAANKQAMDIMLECMNALNAGQGKAADNVTALVPDSNTGQASNTTNCKKKEWANCTKLVFHKS